MVTLWQILSYMFLAILAIFIFRLILHLLIILLSKRKNRTPKLRAAELLQGSISAHWRGE